MAKKTNDALIQEQSEVRKWQSLIQVSLARREEVAQRYNWASILDQTKGFYDIDEISRDPEVDILPINLMHAFLKEEIPSLYLRDPHFEVVPKQNSSILSAKIRELALNYYWRQKRMKRESKKNIWDGKTVGHSWFKVGYTGKFGTIEDGNGHISEFIESEDFFGSRIPFKDVVFNLESVDPPYDCRWIAHAVMRPLEDVKENDRYKNTQNLDGSPMEMDLSNQNIGDTAKRFMQEQKWVKLWEIWDIVKKEVVTIADGHDRILEKKKWPYKMRGYPFSFLGFNFVNDEPYPIPDGHLARPQILELIKIRAQQMDHLKRANRMIESPKGNLDPEEEQNMALGLTGLVVHPNHPGQIKPLEFNTVPPDAYAVEERVKEDMVRVLGQDPVGGVGSQKTTTRTISELLQRQRGVQNRRSEQVDTMEDFLEDISRNLLSLLMQFATQPFYVKLTGEEPETLLEQLKTRPSASQEDAVTTREGFTFTKEDIQGEFDVEIKAGSTIPLERENKLNLLMSLLEMIPKLGAIPGGPVIGTLAIEIADELDMPAIKQALQQEIQMQQDLKEKQEQEIDLQRQIEAAKFGAEKQLEAEKIESKNTGDLLKVATTAINASGGNNGDV